MLDPEEKEVLKTTSVKRKERREVQSAWNLERLTISCLDGACCYSSLSLVLFPIVFRPWWMAIIALAAFVLLMRLVFPEKFSK